jgi:hypothetical protein
MQKNILYCLILFWLLGCGASSENLPPLPKQNLVVNGSFEMLDTTSTPRPKFWKDSLIQIFQEGGYHFGLSQDKSCCGKNSVFISSVETQSYAVWLQPIALSAVVGRRVRLSASVMTENLQGQGFEFGAMCHVEGQSNPQLYTSRAFTSGLLGNRDWSSFIMSFDVPARTFKIEVWLALQTQTTGKVYFDNIELNLM